MNDEPQYPKSEITCTILTGGKGSRMGNRDKGLVPLAGRPMIEHAITRIKPQVENIIISANRNLEKYQSYGYPVISDSSDDFQGPLAGMAACLRHCNTTWMATIPCDVPLFPDKLIARLYGAVRAHRADAAVVAERQWLHSVFCLMRPKLADKLEGFLALGGRKIDIWLRQIDAVQVDFNDAGNCFHNINTAEELSKIDQTLPQK